MIPIKNTLVSRDLIDVLFSCNLSECKGACCVQGDSGPPITQREHRMLKTLFPILKPYMKPESVERADRCGLSFVDQEDELVAMIHENSGECIFAVQEHGITKCVIEELYNDKQIDTQKPVSCHLYPVRVKIYPDFTAVNYDAWDICRPALQQGKSQNLPLYKFVKEALIRRFGTEWYAELEIAAEDFHCKKNNKKV
ncbi:MAG: DUF3109 family protein [Bacteroidales bacterium]|jgi:hypothetical protein